MEETSNKDSKDQRKTKTIKNDQLVVSKKALINVINQQVMNKYLDHDYANLQLLDYGVNKSMTLEQNYTNVMTQHGSKGIYNVNNIMSLDSRVSSKLCSAMSTKFFG